LKIFCNRGGGKCEYITCILQRISSGNEIPKSAFENLSQCALEIERIKQAKGLDLHLGLEPEPLGSFETTQETLSFFERLNKHAGNENLNNCIGVNYDCCHLAVEYENASDGLNQLKQGWLFV
jgi:sugar phosphate isomerase/epimerase